MPDLLSLTAIQEASPSGVIEVGAGMGYWTHLLRCRGVDVQAFDTHAPEESDWKHAFGAERWTDVVIAEEREIRLRVKLAARKGRSLLMVWPPMNGASGMERATDDDMVQRYARAYIESGGRCLMIVGEGEGGCTGWPDIGEPDECVNVPQWAGIHDYLWIWNFGSN